ncbi:LOW QUALITY PROTEIN: tRNA (guanine(10)-N2)-methyltransferase homolog [Leguminivora glycinivorella]|uniref:LOW QUALITY PROTEIN: tRNA (guanine(10)-N2)-methyltransferase homolog n=1 Tax=Leguminivora glycinivorella TaxID=1035111 RepID=UPI00200C78FD|nr:LOW QUALITY PROTEIN: tRNA (guanine(10)-N2)-methyltransferase homolog [Leguminivora glycinivorella]
MHLRKMWPRYLLWFAQEHVDFRHAEMQSLLSMFNIPIRYVEKPCEVKPYWVVEVPSEECVRKLASRSVLLKNCIELWSRAKTEAQLHQNLKRAMQNSTDQWITPKSENGVCDQDVCPSGLIEACRPVDKSFKVEVETFCKHFSMKEKVEKIEKFDYLAFEGPVKLKKPDTVLSYIEFYGLEPNNVPDEPEDLFFGRWVADGQREVIQQHSLKKRTFIGNTSMDPALALLAANQAQLQDGDIALDPFVGSGSLLVAAAHFGAYVCGTDIDFLMLHGRTRPTRVGQKVRKKEESIRANMVQYGYGARFLDVVVSDSSRPLWRRGRAPAMDALLTDPPYGIREPTERVGIERESYSLPAAQRAQHVPAKLPYALAQLYRDLLAAAAALLAPGRRLVAWYPLLRAEYSPEQLPSHPCLELVANSEQVLSRLTARRLLTYEKIREPDGDEAADGGAHNFREKYFNSGEETRRARKERRARELAAYLRQKEIQNAQLT